jgi:hypothetical protein
MRFRKVELGEHTLRVGQERLLSPLPSKDQLDSPRFEHQAVGKNQAFKSVLENLSATGQIYLEPEITNCG